MWWDLPWRAYPYFVRQYINASTSDVCPLAAKFQAPQSTLVSTRLWSQLFEYPQKCL